MKTKFYWFALLASAAMIARANAGGHHGGGGGGNFAAPAPASHAAAPSFGPGGGRSFGGSRFIYSGQRFSSAGVRSFSNRSVRPYNAIVRRGETGNVRNRALTSSRQIDRAGQGRNANALPRNWRNHVATRQSANSHRDWDRRRDHVWNGHHCRFINGSWVIFDYGFYPWWADDYPYGYGYAYGDYPSAYDEDYGVYQGQPYYGYGDNAYGSNEETAIDSPIASVQQQLARLGYYRGRIDGELGPATRQAIARYQAAEGLRATGNLNEDTLRSLGRTQVASY
jgi:hypothetical protein